jgi:TPP-dependent pyruvate/acetoin dehydrogenase alpha subunit
MNISMEKYLEMYERMLQIRYFEEELLQLFMTEKMPGTMHQAIGQEASEVGVCMALVNGDVVVSNHRGHGHALAKGISVDQLMAEMFGKKSGISKGLGGSMHVYDKEKGFFGSNGIVGAGAPIASGVGLALKLENKGNIVVSFLGDGAINNGAVHEAMNLAAVWKLPVLFVCENNQYAVSMPVQRSSLVKNLSERSKAYGMLGITVDGMDVIDVYEKVLTCIEDIRKLKGPAFIECKTYRFRGHSRFEPGNYRPAGELEEWKKKDPIKKLKTYLMDQCKVDSSTIESIEKAVSDEIDHAVQYAKGSEILMNAQITDFVFE